MSTPQFSRVNFGEMPSGREASILPTFWRGAGAPPFGVLREAAQGVSPMIDRPGTGERVYLSIKTYLLSEGALRPGERVDVSDLSRRFGASATPVRAALYRLVGERLLTSLQGEGFLVPRLTEPDLSDLYQWNAALLVNASRAAGDDPAVAPEPPATDGPITALEDLFARLAARSGNVEVEWAVAGASDRLHRPRCAELDLIPEFHEESLELRRLAADGASGALRQALVAYHRRRLRLVPSIVRVLHGLGDRDPRRPAE